MKVPQRGISFRNLEIAFVVLLLLFIGWSLLLLGHPVGVEQLRAYSGGTGPLDSMFRYTSEQAYGFIEGLGDAGRAAYWRFALLDLIYIGIYVSFLIVGIRLFLGDLLPPAHPLRRSVLLPVLAGLADCCEQAGILMILWRYPERLMSLAGVLSYFTTAKFILFYLSFLLMLAAFAGWFGRRLALMRR